MKNKSIWIFVALVVVVLVGGALYFGDSATQKGALMPIRPTASCGAVWTKVATLNDTAPMAYLDAVGGGFTSDSAVPPNLYNTLKTYTQNGCSFRGMIEETLDTGTLLIHAFDCESVEVADGGMGGGGGKGFMCKTNNIFAGSVISSAISISTPDVNTYFNFDGLFPYGTTTPLIQSISVSLFAKK